MVTLIERESKTEIKQGQDNHTDEKAEIDLMDILRKIIGIRKIIYKAAGIGLLIGVIVAISIPEKYTVGVTLSPEMGNTKGSKARDVLCIDDNDLEMRLNNLQ